MSALASNRTVSATVLLSLIVVTGGCLAMASAVPVANGRRLQQLVVVGGELTSQLQALTSGLQKLSDQLQLELSTLSGLPADLLAQLQQVATSFDVAQRELQSNVQALLGLPASVLGLPDNQVIVQNLLAQFKTELQYVLTQFQNPQPVGGCFTTQQVNVLGAITDLTGQLKSATSGLLISMQPLVLIADLQSLGNAVSQVNPCASGLETLLSHGDAVLALLGELLVAIQ
ncbi:unnamed protein product [Urochloa decumbens]|uniref:Uncharacterized protein n=1 Tax=Urochloa decumbens TaxID=240449 RepID=A0ABC8Y2D4_9POAL